MRGSLCYLVISDAKHARKEASGAEDLRVYHHKGEFGAAVRQEKYQDTEKLSRRKRAEIVNSGNRSKDWKARSASKREVQAQTEEEEEVGPKENEVHFLSEFEEREIDLNDRDDSGGVEEQGHTEKSRMYQGQQLDEMDKFDRDEVTEDAYKHQGQLLDDMDKFDNRQVADDTNRHMFEDDAVPKVVELNWNRKYQMVNKHRTENQAKGSSSMRENDTRGHLQDGKKESRKLGYRGDNGSDVLNKEREDEEQEDSDKLERSIGDTLGSEDRVLRATAIKQTSEAPEGSIRAAIEQEMEKRSGGFTREGRDTLRRSLGETNLDIGSLRVKNSSEKTNLKETVETGMLPLRGFKELLDNMKAGHNNDDESVVRNVVQKDEKNKDAEILAEGSSQARRLPPWDIETTVEDVVVDSLNFPNVTGKEGDVKQSSRSAQAAAKIDKPDYTGFDDDVNLKLNVEISKADKQQLIKEDQLDNVEDIKNESEKEIESRNANVGDEVEEELESRKNNKNDSGEEENDENDHDNMIQWGFYPTLSKTLKFSKFLSAFFKQESCSLRIFMAWTTAPWAYTPRHQRAIESILHFHPQACIVVFTETIDFKFFDSWVKEGYDSFNFLVCYIQLLSWWSQPLALYFTRCCLTNSTRFHLLDLHIISKMHETRVD